MINYETFAKIKHLHEEQGLNAIQIAQELSLDERTVRKWLEEPSFKPRKGVSRPSKLDPFKDEIRGMLERHDYTGAQIYDHIRKQGYSGGRTILLEYIRRLRPKRKPAYLTLSFEPGDCAQVDWGEFGTVPVGQTRRRLSFFAIVLCHSRQLYVRFTLGQSMEHFLECHQKAFEYFGGIPRRIMVDNLKCAVLRRTTGGVPVFNSRYHAFARHYGFRITPCNVRAPHEKGIVENAVGYVKSNFLNGKSFSDFSQIQPLAEAWLLETANVRRHGTTKESPMERFESEKLHLLSLPLLPAEIAEPQMVRTNSRFRVLIDTNRYSVPAEYASTLVKLFLYADHLRIWHEGREIAHHIRSYERNQDIEKPDHCRAILAQRGRARWQKLLIRFLQLTRSAEAYYQGLKVRHLNISHHIRQIMALSETYGIEKTARALEDSFAFGVFGAAYIANLLEQRERKLPDPAALHLTRREDLLDLELPTPDLSVYDTPLDEQDPLPPKEKGEDHEPEITDAS